MSKKQTAEFICKATDFNVCSENDDRVKNFQKEYDSNNDGFVELKEFLTFYLNAAMNKKSTVFDNLKSLGYGKDLKLKSEQKIKGSLNYKESIRYKLICNGDFYLKNILQNFERLSNHCSEMIVIMRKEGTIEEEKENIKKKIKLMIRWSSVLKKFVYTMPPSLSIVEDILCKEMKIFEDLNKQGQFGFYKLIILFGILFKPKAMKKILGIISCEKSGITQTSNDNLNEGKLKDFINY